MRLHIAQTPNWRQDKIEFLNIFKSLSGLGNNAWKRFIKTVLQGIYSYMLIVCLILMGLIYALQKTGQTCFEECKTQWLTQTKA